MFAAQNVTRWAWPVVLSLVACWTFTGCKQSKGPLDIPVVVTIDWFDVERASVRYPAIKVSGTLFVGTKKQRGPGVIALHEVIDANEYFGINVIEGSPGAGSESKHPVLEVYLRRRENGQKGLRVLITTMVNCELLIENLAGGRIRDRNTKASWEPPYVFKVGTYDIEILTE